MARYGYIVMTKVADVVENDAWGWPEAWRSVYPVLFQLPSINITNAPDQILWRNAEGKLVPFATKEVWNTIRIHGQPKDWSNFVWSASSIRKHAFLCWLILKRKLWTQDRIMQWNRMVHGSMNQMCCLLCYADLETHEHLFFQCSYSKKVWNIVSSKAGITMVNEKWDEIVEWMIPRAKSKAISLVASRLIIAVAAYVIWSERNARFFSNRLRPPEQISDVIMSTVRTKLISFKYKANVDVRRFLKELKIDGVEFFDED
ncbi:uncharacterized protein LOC110931763 [Helianthus annuus]|uniref:uncharacterized protein LOC110931763 n=1 Tax=Helianthus annuus TaxID=4232 RepID=UPI000B9039A4|nr:uncharacterized protein LOC110931763 [Helianthus annuus]